MTTAPFQVLVIRFLDRVGKGIRTSPRDALIADSVDKKDYGQAFSFQRALDHAGAVFGPVVAFVLLNIFFLNLRVVFALPIIPAIITIFILTSFLNFCKFCSYSRLEI
ncbi:MAG: MFS transporter [bacterium]|nr:MFS transporter [bacterium]